MFAEHDSSQCTYLADFRQLASWWDDEEGTELEMELLFANEGRCGARTGETRQDTMPHCRDVPFGAH